MKHSLGLKSYAWSTNAGLNKRSVRNAGYNAGSEKSLCGGRNVKLSHQNTVLTTSTSTALLFYNALRAHSNSEIKAQLEFLCLDFSKLKLHIIITFFIAIY